MVVRKISMKNLHLTKIRCYIIATKIQHHTNIPMIPVLSLDARLSSNLCIYLVLTLPGSSINVCIARGFLSVMTKTTHYFWHSLALKLDQGQWKLVRFHYFLQLVWTTYFLLVWSFRYISDCMIWLIALLLFRHVYYFNCLSDLCSSCLCEGRFGF